MYDEELSVVTENSHHKEGLPYRLYMVPVVILTAAFFLNFISRIILSPLVPAVESDLGLSHRTIGSFFLLITAGYFVSLICSGFISSRINHRWTIALSLAMLGCGLLLVSRAVNTGTIALGMFAIGLFTGLYLPSGIASITDIVHPAKWGRAFAVHELAPALSFLMAPFIAESLLCIFSWRGVIAIIGCLVLLGGVVFPWIFRAGEFHGKKPEYHSALALFKDPSFLIITALFSLGIGSTIGVYSMLPLYLVVEHGIERFEANTLVFLSRILPLGTVFLGGWAVDRFGEIKTIRLVFFVTGIFTILLGIVPSPLLRVVVFLQPLSSVCVFPAGFALLSATVPPESRNLAVSFSMPIAFLVGAGLFPTGIGFMGDAGIFQCGFMIVGGLIFTGGILARLANLREG